MLSLVGDFGKFALIDGSRTLDINLEPSTQFFQEVAIKKSDMYMNEFGLYSFIQVGRHGKAKMNSMSVPKHLLQSRKNCLTWTPKGQLFMKPDEIQAYPVEYMGEQCTDTFMGECLEYVLGEGNAVRDIFATAEGAALWEMAVNNIFLGLGNDLYDLATFGMDSLITSSDTNNWWNKDASSLTDWDNFLDQQMNIGVKGHIPLIEEAKAAGLAHFNVDIPSGDVSGAAYIGSDVTALFDSVIAAATTKLRVLRKRRGQPAVVMPVSQGIFDAYKTYIVSNFNTIPDVYQFFLNGEAVPGVLKYDGTPVICMDEWKQHDEMLGINSHRVILTAVRNFVIAQEMESLPQFNGLGMRIEQSMRLKDKGVVYMNTNFMAGAGIADTDFMVNASRILTP